MNYETGKNFERIDYTIYELILRIQNIEKKVGIEVKDEIKEQKPNDEIKLRRA